jgi:LmbE family N-acetylglucosaminyl deacetylase
MGTLVCFHAHPDDEAITTGGSMARAHAEGHRVVLVVATDGAFGEVPADLAEGETLPDRRRRETNASAEALGIDRVEFLGYADSGMTGWKENANPECFFQADLDEAGGRLASILADEQADVLTSYDWHGNYGHPDHVQVHRVANRAEAVVAERLPGLRVLEATMNRDAMKVMMAQAAEAGEDFGPERDDGETWDPDAPMDDDNPMGTPEAELTMEVDVSEFVRQKRAAIGAHSSQVSDSSFFMQMSDDVFAAAFGREWFVEHAVAPGMTRGWIFDD